MNNTFLVRGESVCLEIGFGKVKLVRLGESGRVAHKVGAVFARAMMLRSGACGISPCR